MKDWLGQEYRVGDTVVYPAGSGRSITVVLAEVTGISENASGVVRVTVRPLGSSRWTQHYGTTRYIDKRTGKGIDPFATDKHTEVPAHFRHKETGETITGEEYENLRFAWYSNRGNVEYYKYRFVSAKWKDYVERVTEATKRVTLSVTENITKVPPELVLSLDEKEREEEDDD